MLGIGSKKKNKTPEEVERLQLSVREENMTKRENEFKEMMTFQRTQMDAHFERFESLVNVVVGKLPNVSIGGTPEAVDAGTTVETRSKREKKAS